MDADLTPVKLLRWRLAVLAIFLTAGVSVASWAARVPAIKTTVGIDNAQIGILLLGGGIASIVGVSTSPLLAARVGARRGMLTAMVLFAAGLLVVGLGADAVASPVVVAVGLALWGFGNGSLDVMMNVEGAAIEVHTGRTLLPMFHAFFSFGTVIGAGLGAGAIALGLGVLAHLAVVSVLVVVAAVLAVANVPTREPITAAPETKTGWRERLAASGAAWREPRTYALGVVILGMSFAEGGANDWLALGIVEGHDAPEHLGAIGLAVFSISMTAVRLLGGPLVDRFGRVPVLRVLAAAAVAGLLLFVLAPTLPLVFVGAALWGVGVSLGFPLGMSAAADDPAHAAARVSATATIGYIAFLAGPPLLGLVSEHIGLLNTLLALVVLAIASGLASGAARPLGAVASRESAP